MCSLGDESLPERFWSKVSVNEETGCWEWAASCNRRTGYGQFSPTPTTNRTTHRIAYETLVGPIPDGLVIDHLCRVRRCVNPSHMEIVTHRVNLLRGETKAAGNAAKTHCPKGHPYSGDNLQIHVTRGGSVHRKCRTCRAKESHESYRRRARAAAQAREAA